MHPFFICVGREEEPCRIRRVTFPYDANCPGEACSPGTPFPGLRPAHFDFSATNPGKGPPGYGLVRSIMRLRLLDELSAFPG
jgi:hypothetical protein